MRNVFYSYLIIYFNIKKWLLDVVINFDADRFEVGVGLERVMDSFSTRSRLLATSERHVEAANEPAVLPDGSSLKAKSYTDRVMKKSTTILWLQLIRDPFLSQGGIEKSDSNNRHIKILMGVFRLKV